MNTINNDCYLCYLLQIPSKQIFTAIEEVINENKNAKLKTSSRSQLWKQNLKTMENESNLEPMETK